MGSLDTTNVLLSVLTVLGLLEALAFVVVLTAGVVVVRRIGHTVTVIEANHVAPAAKRLHAILDDINEVTSNVKGDVHQIQRRISWVLRWIRIPKGWPDSTNPGRKEAHHA